MPFERLRVSRDVYTVIRGKGWIGDDVSPARAREVDMALSVELLMHGRLVDKSEQWWDDVESALELSGLDLPLLKNVDPYDEVQIPRNRFGELIEECRQLSLRSAAPVSRILQRVAQLAEVAIRHPDAELWFIGE